MGKRQRLLERLNPLLFFTALSLVYTWPLARLFSTHMVGFFRDGPMFLWNLWWGKFSLGSWPLYSYWIFYPEGTTLATHTHTILPAVLSVPLQQLFGLVPAYNLMMLGTYVTSGLAAYLLCHEVTRSRAAALVGGVAFAFCHFRSSTIVFFNLSQSQFLVLYIWSLLRFWRAPGYRHASFAAASVVLLLYSSYNLLVLALLFTVLFGLFELLTDTRHTLRLCGTRFREIACAMGIVLVCALPLALELWQELSTHGYYLTLERARTYEQAKPLWTLFLRLPLSNDLLRDVRASYLGWSVIGLSAYALWARERLRVTSFWAIASLVFLVISLGPVLQFGGERLSGFRLPYYWLRELPLIREVRVPHRYGLAGALGLAVLASLGARALLERFHSAKLRQGAAVALALVIFADFTRLPFRQLYPIPEPPAVIRAIAEDPRELAVLHYPAGRTGVHMFSYYSTVHGKPSYLSGEIARRGPHIQARRDRSALLRTLDAAYRSPDSLSEIPPTLVGELRDEIRAQRLGWIVLALPEHADRISPDSLKAVRRLVAATVPDARVLYEKSHWDFISWSAGPDLREDPLLYVLELPRQASDEDS